MKYSILQTSKTLDKLFKAGFNEEKKIINMTFEDFNLLQDGSLIDMKIIIEFKKALKEKKLFQFLTNELNLDNK